MEVDFHGKHFLMPFVRSVWVCILVVMILVSSVLRLIQWHDNSDDNNTLILTFGVFCQQG